MIAQPGIGTESGASSRSPTWLTATIAAGRGQMPTRAPGPLTLAPWQIVPVNQLHAVPFTANEVGTALVVLFHEPLKPMLL